MTTTAKRKRWSQVIAPRRHRKLHRQLYPAPLPPRRNQEQNRIRPKGLHAYPQRTYLLFPTTKAITKYLLLMIPPQSPPKNRSLHPIHALRLKEVIASCRPSHPLRPLRGRFQRYLIARRCRNSFRTSGRISSEKKNCYTLLSPRRRKSA